MREINLEEYNKSKRERKLKMLKIRDRLRDENSDRSGSKNRSQEKRVLLYKLALKAKKRKFKKISDSEYRLLDNE